MLIKKTVIVMDYECNNKCIFCCNGNKRNNIKPKTTKEIKRELIKAKKNGSTYIEFIGGEPTIRKDFLEVVNFAKFLEFDIIMLATNGRMLSDFVFAKEIIKHGINFIVFSIHGYNSKMHDYFVNVDGAFDQLISGIKNIKKLGLTNIGTNTTIIKQNYKFLEKIGKLIYNLGIKNSEFIFVDPTIGISKENFFSIVPKYEDVSKYVNKLLSFGERKKIDHWYIRYYPLCFIDEKYHHMVSEIREKKFFQTVHIAPDFINNEVYKSREEIGRVKIDKCKKCHFKTICEGYWQEYVNMRSIK